MDEITHFLEETLYCELFSCTEYQAAVQNDDLGKAGEWYELWHDTVAVLHKKQYMHHECLCHGSLYHFVLRQKPSFGKDMW